MGFKGERNPLILPAHVPMDDPRVQTELTRYLPENWLPVIERDIDGVNSLPSRIDGEVPNLGKYSACRRVARSIYLGSAPIPAAANQGIEDRWIKLGCVIPGESPAVFGDAMRRLGSEATYLYQDGARYWYSIQPTVANLAESRAEEYRRDRDKVDEEIARRLREEDALSKEETPESTMYPKSRRYHGSVKLDPTRVGRDASQVADEVIAHLEGLVGSEVRLTLEIEADIPDGAPEHVIRIVIENSRNLNFDDSGFENE